MESLEDIAKVARLIPSHTYLLTAAFDEIRCGVLTRWVQQCASDPPSVIVAIKRGSPIEPLVRDGRCFALCRVHADDRHILRRFSEPALRGEDPFLALPSFIAATGAPIIERAQCYYDCELVGHLAPELDTRLYIGAIKAAGVLKGVSDDPPTAGEHGAPGTNGTNHENGSNGSAITRECNDANGSDGAHASSKTNGVSPQPE